MGEAGQGHPLLERATAGVRTRDPGDGAVLLADHPQTIISIHQPLASVDFSGGDPEVTRWLSRNLNLPKSHIQISGGGTMTSWYNRRLPKQTAVTVELPPATTPEYRERVANVLLRHANTAASQL